MSGTMFDQTTDTDAPEPGIYTGVPFEEYAGWPLLNASALKKAYLKDDTPSMKHLKCAIENGGLKDTPDRKLGRDIHCRLLEPERFREEYVIAEQCGATVEKTGKRCANMGKALVDGEWRCGQHAKNVEPPENIIRRDRYERVQQVATAVVSHDSVRLMRSHGGVEVSLVFDYPITFVDKVGEGEDVEYTVHRTTVRMKSRLDKLIDDPLTIIDIKKVQAWAIDNRSLMNQIAKFKYDISAHVYCKAVQLLMGSYPRFFWVFVEDDLPHDVSVQEAHPEVLAIGKTKAESLLSDYARCRHVGHWPGVCEPVDGQIPKIMLPEWEMKKWTKDI